MAARVSPAQASHYSKWWRPLGSGYRRRVHRARLPWRCLPHSVPLPGRLPPLPLVSTAQPRVSRVGRSPPGAHPGTGAAALGPQAELPLGPWPPVSPGFVGVFHSPCLLGPDCVGGPPRRVGQGRGGAGRSQLPSPPGPRTLTHRAGLSGDTAHAVLIDLRGLIYTAFHNLAMIKISRP